MFAFVPLVVRVTEWPPIGKKLFTWLKICFRSMSHRIRKQTIWLSDKVWHKSACTVTKDGYKLAILDISRRDQKRNCTIRLVKIKALISCAVTAQLICVFVFAYADCWFSGVLAQYKYLGPELQCFLNS